MARGAPDVVIELDGTRMRGVGGRAAGSRVDDFLAIQDDRPEGVRPDDPASVGEWIGRVVRASWPRARRVAFAVSRGDIVLKGVAIPSGASLSAREVAGMVRLSMARQLATPVDDAVVDYLDRATGGSDAVLAGAMARARVDWWRAVADHAGLSLSHLALRSAGTARCLAEFAQRQPGPTLGVALAPSAAEFVVIEDGRLAFARAVDLGPGAGDDPNALAERVAVEAKRTWVSHRAGRAGAEAEAIGVLGSGALVDHLTARCAGALSCPAKGIEAPVAGAIFPEGWSALDRAAAMPLLGVLLDLAAPDHSLNFAEPRRLPDVHARLRMGALVGVLGAIVLAGGAYVLGSTHLARLRSVAGTLEARVAQLETSHQRLLADQARLGHIRAWLGTRTDVVDELATVVETMPPATQAVLDELVGVTGTSIAFTPAQGAPGDLASGAWRTEAQFSLRVEGQTIDREGVTGWRGRFVSGDLAPRFSLDNQGADRPDRFAFDLRAKPRPGGGP